MESFKEGFTQLVKSIREQSFNPNIESMISSPEDFNAHSTDIYPLDDTELVVNAYLAAQQISRTKNRSTQKNA